MEGLLETALLYDFYGELLTGHQREIYEDFTLNDLSLGEIAENRGISRQGVHDIIKRCRKQLIAYEDKLHLVAKFMQAKESIEEIDECAQKILQESDSGSCAAESAGKIKNLTEKLMKEL